MNRLVLFALTSTLFISCKKELSKNPPKTETDPIPQFAMTAAKVQYSKKILKREISSVDPNTTFKYVKIFSYDAFSRCSKIEIGTIDSSAANPSFLLKQTITFTYEGSITILPSSFSSVRTVFPNLVTTYYYTYNALGRKIKDSVRVKNQAGEPADRVIHYVYNKEKVSVTPVLTGFPMENNSYDTLSLLSGGNIEKLTSRIIKTSGDQTVVYSFTYDKYISPYNKLNISNSLYFESASLGIGYNVPLETHYMGVTTNNLTSWTTNDYTVQFKYVYDSDLYPVRKEMCLPGKSLPSQVTLFEY
ncbi:MAG: hypothetical protein QM725_18510 [Lacibacter sp.]